LRKNTYFTITNRHSRQKLSTITTKEPNFVAGLRAQQAPGQRRGVIEFPGRRVVLAYYLVFPDRSILTEMMALNAYPRRVSNPPAAFDLLDYNIWRHWTKNRRRKKVLGWTLKMKGEVLEKIGSDSQICAKKPFPCREGSIFI